ncbi:MAG: ATP-binding protein [Hyphomonadaceae bacterium]
MSELPPFSLRQWFGTRRRQTALALTLCLVGAALSLSDILRGVGAVACIAGALALGWLASAQPAPAEQAPAPAPAPPPPAEPGLNALGPVLEAIEEPVLLIDGEGRVASSNAAARRMLGFASNDVRLESVLRRPELLDAARAALQDGATQAVDYEVAAPVEEHFIVRCAPAAFGAHAGALMVFYDQTTAINTERMRADFLANASHELRTPLASMTLLLETLSGHAREDPAARDRFIKLMLTQADRMRDLINDLLSLSKIELNEHVPPAGEVDLVSMTREALDVVAPLAQQRGVTLDTRVDAPGVRVMGDRSQLMQVVHNLVDNAIKYSPSGAMVTIELGAGEDREEAAARAGRQWPEASRFSLLSPPPAAGRRYAYLRVTDAGAGIARRYLPRLSERFFRVEREESSDQPGTGLGLAIVKHIVNRHRGGFIVESLPGKGSAFAVYIERPAADAGPGQAAARAEPAVSS